MTLEIIPGTSEDRTYIDDRLDEFNNKQVPFTQKKPFVNIDYILKDNDKIIGGITAYLYCWKCFIINVLWVDENYRHLGYGSKLLAEVEAHAKKLGATLAHLHTYDFQAKDFYLKQGYEIFAVLEDCPPGHKQFSLKKKL